MTTFLSKIYHFIILTCSKYNIDESHGMIHSMNTLHYTYEIFTNEARRYPFMVGHEKVAYISAAIHDMCDKKYMNEEEGIDEIARFLKDDVTVEEMDIVKKIIGTMSYSKVKKNGFPDLGTWQNTYHCVREADLLCAYDFDRSMIYHMSKEKCNIEEAFINAEQLFHKRVFKQKQDGLFLTDFAKCKSVLLERGARSRILNWRTIIYKKL
jgi:hypothetical protein